MDNEIKKLYGPYERKDRRVIIVHYLNGRKRTMQYAKFLMEQHIGRELNPETETVDHIDGNAFNDSLDNLQIIPPVVHQKLDVVRLELTEFICQWCKNKASRRAGQLHRTSKLGKAGPFCGKSCAGKYGASVQNGADKFTTQSAIPIDKRVYYTNKELDKGRIM